MHRRLQLRLVVAGALVASGLVPVTIAATSTTAAEPAARATAHKAKPASRLPRPDKKQTKAPDYDRHTVLVRFKPGVSAKTRQNALGKRNLRSVQTTAGITEVATTQDAAVTVAQLRKDPSVAAVSLDYVRHKTTAPNDAYYASGDQRSIDAVRLPSAWNVVKDTSKQVIAVLDTGVWTGHPDLKDKLVPGYNAAYPGQSYNDIDGHGTMVAGIAAANTNNTTGIAGAAWNGRIMPVRVFRSPDAAYDSDIIRGIDWAATHGARIINMSLGGSEPSPLIQDTIRWARDTHDVLVVVAAGNSGQTRPEYPAAYPEALAVGATDDFGNLTDFSTSGSWVDVAAPGYQMLSTYPVTSAPYYGYAVGDGTSFSSPLVAGIAALVRTRFPTMTAAQVLARIRSTARDAGPRGIDSFYGGGLIDAYAAIGGARTTDLTAHPSDGNDVPARATAIQLGASAQGSITSAGDVDWYRIEVPTARTLDVKVTPPAYNVDRAQNIDPVVDVYDDQLRLLGEGDSEFASNPESVSVTVKAGMNYLAVRNYNGSVLPATAQYQLTMTSAEPPGLLGSVIGRYTLSNPRAVAVGEVAGPGGSAGEDVVVTTGTSSPAEPSDNSLIIFTTGPYGVVAGEVQSYPLPAGRVAQPVPVLVEATGDAARDVAIATSSGIMLYPGKSVIRPDGSSVRELDTPRLLAGTGVGTFLTAANVDGDGDTDLVASTPHGVRAYLQQADHTFTTESVAGDLPAQLAVGDVDGGGTAEIIGYTGTAIRVYHRNGPGQWSFSDKPVVNAGGQSIAGIAVADINADHRDDVLAVVRGSATGAGLDVFRQSAAGMLEAPELIALPPNAGAVAAGDVDFDQRTDVVVAHPDSLSTLQQKPDGTLGAPAHSAIRPTSSAAGALVTGSVDGSGPDDVVVTTAGVGASILLGSPQPGSPAVVSDVSIPNGTTDVALNAAPVLTLSPTLTDGQLGNVRLQNASTGADVTTSFGYDAGTHQVTLTPDQPLQDNTAYRIVVENTLDPTDGSRPLVEFTSMFRTVDTAPGAVSGFDATGGYLSATLKWQLPPITDLGQVIVRRSTGGAAPGSPTEGVAVYAGTATTATATGLGAGGTYIFRAWVKDKSGKTSPPAETKLIGTKATIAASTTALTFGGSVTLSGKLTRADTGAPMAGSAVRLYARQKGATAWRLLRTATASSTGTVSYVYKPSFGNDFQWRWETGTADLIGTGSTLVSTGVRVAVTANLSRTTAPLGTAVAMSGSVSPNHAGQYVYLQRYLGNNVWTNETAMKLSSTSVYSFHPKPAARGTYYYRVVRPADTDHLLGVSPTKSFRVT